MDGRALCRVLLLVNCRGAGVLLQAPGAGSDQGFPATFKAGAFGARVGPPATSRTSPAAMTRRGLRAVTNRSASTGAAATESCDELLKLLTERLPCSTACGW